MSCLRTQHNVPGQDPESSTLTMRPPHLPWYLLGVKKFMPRPQDRILVPLSGSFQNFRRAPPFFLYGSPLPWPPITSNNAQKKGNDGFFMRAENLITRRKTSQRRQRESTNLPKVWLKSPCIEPEPQWWTVIASWSPPTLFTENDTLVLIVNVLV